MNAREKLIEVISGWSLDCTQITDAILASGTYTPHEPKEDPVDLHPIAKQAAERIEQLEADIDKWRAAWEAERNGTRTIPSIRDLNGPPIIPVKSATESLRRACGEADAAHGDTPDLVEAETMRLYAITSAVQPSAFMETWMQDILRTLAADSLARQCAARIAGIQERCGCGRGGRCSCMQCEHIGPCGELQLATYARYGQPV